MQLGLIQCIEGPIVFLTEDARTRMKFEWGDYIQISSDERDSSVIRRLRPVQTCCAVKTDYVYADATTLHLLCCCVGDPVFVEMSALPLECP